MVKILNTEQIKALDAATIVEDKILSIELMERACRSFVKNFIGHFDASLKIGIVCGTGNNGGDGLGIARLLSELQYDVKVWLVRGTAPQTPDFLTNLEKLPKKVVVAEPSIGHTQSFEGCNIWIDAIFGSGLSRPLAGVYQSVVRSLNTATGIKVAVDIPSGLLADGHSLGEIVKADLTITFQLPKLAFMFPENSIYVGNWEIADIGLSPDFTRKTETPYRYITGTWVGKQLKDPEKFAHKGTFGKALLIAGSFGKMGACVLAARGVIRSGAGLLTAHIPGCGYTVMQTAVPEAMVSVDSHDEVFSNPPDPNLFNAIGIGPGLGTSKETVNAFQGLLAMGRRMVIDADAINILSAHRELIHLLSEGSILTPHPGEFERVAGKWNNDFERLDLQVRFAALTKCVIVLKGAHTSIAMPDGRVFFNSTGNPGMATGGSGDVLTGVLTGLVAQGYSSEDAALIGVFLHGLAGDLAAKKTGTRSLIASDIVDFIPESFRLSF